MLDTLKPMETNELRAYITSAAPDPGAEHFVVFPENPKNLERFYDVRTKDTFVYNGSEWLKEDPQPIIEVMSSPYLNPDEYMLVQKPRNKPAKSPARTPQGMALEEAKRMEREMQQYYAARDEMNRRMEQDSYVHRMTQDYNELRIKQPWLTAQEAAEYIRRKYNP